MPVSQDGLQTMTVFQPLRRHGMLAVRRICLPARGFSASSRCLFAVAARRMKDFTLAYSSVFTPRVQHGVRLALQRACRRADMLGQTP